MIDQPEHASWRAQRRTLLLGAVAGLAPALGSAAKEGPQVDIWKSPTCGCCYDWMQHMRANGFRVTYHDEGNDAKRAAMGIALRYGSCHTAVVEGYAIEGHVPAREVQRLLRERPAAIGLAVPGMPIGSPGMDGPAYGGRKEAYAVLLLTKGGGSIVYQTYS